MLLHLLLHLLIYHLLSARDAPPSKEAGYVIRHLQTCPDVGYYFKREPSPNSIQPGQCYLCFCQEDNTAICWKRDNRRCNVESFHYHGVGKRDTRIRRSPGFADIFFRDATRDVFEKNTKPECKPYQSSFSDDCPPTDWCVGCTVCDCDANGRWDCHLLSFCPDNKGKKKSGHQNSKRKIVVKKPVKKQKTATSPPKKTPPRPRPARKTETNKMKPKANPPIKRAGNHKVPPRKRTVRAPVPFKPKMTPGPYGRRPQKTYKKISPRKPEAKKEMIIKRNIATHKPIDIKATKFNIEMEIAQKVMKKIMANLKKTISNEMMNMSKLANEVVQSNNAANNDGNNRRNNGGNNNKKKPKSIKVVKRQIQKPKKKPMKAVRKPVRKPIKKPARQPPPNNDYRRKRDVSLVGDISTNVTQGKPDVVTNTTAEYSVKPVTSNLLVPDDANCTHTPVEISTLPEHEYYKYVVGSEEPKVKIDGPMGDKGTAQVNLTETVFNLIGTQMNSILPAEKGNTTNNKANKITSFTIVNPEENELKYSKWSHLKILKEKKFHSGSDKHKSLVKIISHTNNSSVLEDHRNKVLGKNIERVLNSRKYTIVKLINHPKKRNKKDNSTNILMANKKKGNLQNLVNSLLVEFHNNNTPNSYKKNRKLSILKYLKRIFNKIFKRKKTLDQFSKHNLIETLCENFGPCQINRQDKVYLNTKLVEFDEETKNILKTVKIIKGLLKLVELPKSNDSESTKHDYFQNDINKLSKILKGFYGKDGQASLSATQFTQIEYIKRNTKDFIQSVSRFTSILNEIITVLTKHNINASKHPDRVLRNSFMDNNLTKDDPFQNLRHLLERYNLIQNSFMQQMYEQLNYFENKINEKPKVSEVKDLNNSVAIENFSRNIIHNLRKLKLLVQTMNSSGRRKRETVRDDDAIEYLLMMMEYLLKQNHPLDAAPVNDGIDLLIEAIKNAPDIKPIKKKVLEYTVPTYSDTTTTPSHKSATIEGSLSEDDMLSESDRTSSEDSGIFKQEYPDDKLKNKMEENKELVEMIAENENDKDPEDNHQYDRRAGIDKLDEITETVFYNKIEDNTVLESENGLETTTIMPLEMEVTDKLDKDDVNIDRTLAIQTNNLDKPIEKTGEGKRKFEIFTGDMDEEMLLPGTMITTVSELPTTVTTEFTNEAESSKPKMKYQNLESYDSEHVDKKSKLEWIEENFGRENGERAKDLEENNTTLPTAVTVKPTETKTIDKAQTRRPSQEVIDEDDRKNKAKINAEEVMLRKQMDLLNSLDYGTEKIEVYESDSKDANADDRYASDNFPSYFT